jgi:putative FmdB family regulatory protein
MPIYEYECNACGERHEFIQKFSDAPMRKCPACGKSRLRKLVSAAAFHLKGNGWYVTDFRDKDKKNGKDGKDDKSAGKSDSTDSQSDSKSDRKSDSKSDAGSGSTAESKSDAKSEPKADKKAAAKKGDSSATPAP